VKLVTPPLELEFFSNEYEALQILIGERFTELGIWREKSKKERELKGSLAVRGSGEFRDRQLM